LKKTVLDNQDFKILNLVASSGQPSISSWEICQKLFPDEDNPQNHLSSVIWRLEKLTKTKFLNQLPHPTRGGKAVYSLPDYAFSVDGTIFIPSKVGGVIVNCKFIDDCKAQCDFGSSRCKLASLIRKEGLEPVLKIAEVLSKKNNETKEEEVKEIAR
jgi:hypothetical protein